MISIIIVIILFIVMVIFIIIIIMIYYNNFSAGDLSNFLGHEFFSCLSCRIFWVGSSLCNNFFNIKNRTWVVESTCLIFSPMAPLEQFFPVDFDIQVFFWRNYPPLPLSKKN